MANNKLITDEKVADLGNFLVGRLLPLKQKRQVGPFTFIDHMGPAKIEVGNHMDVDQHPHIGLCTLTYLFEGAIEHRDSTGAHQIINSGDVGFMTAGSGVTHTERTPHDLRSDTFIMHGYQIWVALPKEKEEIAPRFDYLPSKDVPTWSQNGMVFKLPAGSAFGEISPITGYSPMFMVDITTEKENTLDLRNQIQGEVAFVIVKGSINVGEEEVHAGQMLISKTDDVCEINMNEHTSILLFGGQPLPEEHYLLWNLVSHSKDRLEKGREDWINKKFRKVPEDNTYIPFPKYLLKRK